MLCNTVIRYLWIELLYTLYTNGEERERERETEKPRKTFAEGLVKNPRRKAFSRSHSTRSQRMVLSPSTFIPLLLGQTRLLRYPSRAAVSSFASSRRRSHPRRRMSILVPGESLFSDSDGNQSTPPVKYKLYLSLRYVLTMSID